MSVEAARRIKRGRPDLCLSVLVIDKLADCWSNVPEVDELLQIKLKTSVFAVARRIRGRFDVAILFQVQCAPESRSGWLEFRAGSVCQSRGGISSSTSLSTSGRDRFRRRKMSRLESRNGLGQIWRKNYPHCSRRTTRERVSLNSEFGTTDFTDFPDSRS